MPKTYFDAGALAKLYIVEEGSDFVQKKARAAREMPLNELQETELRNAIHAATGRGTISTEAGTAALTYFENDIREGVLSMESPDWPAVWKRASHLARLHTAKILCRTLDILHVAAAEHCEAELFVTGDTRQFKLCKAVGLPAAFVNTSHRAHP